MATLRGGFQYTLLTRGGDIRRQPGISIREVLNNTPNTCTFVIDGSSNIPTIGEKIEIRDSFDGDRLLFAGTVQSFEQVYEGQTNQLAFNVQCVDFTWSMNRKRPVGAFTNISASDLVKHLIDVFAPGFTTDNVQTNLAPVTVILDGSRDLVEVLTDIAQAIGGGHWYVDYFQDVHFFHVSPLTSGGFTSSAPPTGSPAAIPGEFPTGHITVAEGASFIGLFGFEPGQYIFRFTMLYSNGVESRVGKISDVITLDGTKEVILSTIPIGIDPAPLTVVARRIYFNKLTKEGFPLERLEKYVQLDDNATTTFTSWFGTVTANSAAVIPIPAAALVPRPSVIGHLPGPVTRISAQSFFLNVTSVRGLRLQFKCAFLYRDGRISFVGPASDSAGNRSLIGLQLLGFDLTGIPFGRPYGDNDVVARLIYSSAGRVGEPNASGGPASSIDIGKLEDPTWAESEVNDFFAVIPGNDTQRLTHVAPENGPIGLGFRITSNEHGAFDGARVGFGNRPAINRFAMDPDLSGTGAAEPSIPAWPNADGPFLENADPPDDLDNANPDLLHVDSGSQALMVSTDLSQVRNRVTVIGAGSIVLQSAFIGQNLLRVNEITGFSFSGGQLQLIDPSSGKSEFLDYVTVSGEAGANFIILANLLTSEVSQGAMVNNFFIAEDIESQEILGRTELDKDGNPTDGIHEFTIVDRSLTTSFQMFMRARAELEIFGRPTISIRYATRDNKTRPGRTVHVDMTNPPIVGDFLIQDVTIDQIQESAGIETLSPRYTAMASSVKFELNDLLLQSLRAIAGGGIGSGAGLVQTAGDIAAENPLRTIQVLIDPRALGGENILIPGVDGKTHILLSYAAQMDIITAGGQGVNATNVRYRAFATNLIGAFTILSAPVPAGTRFTWRILSAFNVQGSFSPVGADIVLNSSGAADGGYEGGSYRIYLTYLEY